MSNIFTDRNDVSVHALISQGADGAQRAGIDYQVHFLNFRNSGEPASHRLHFQNGSPKTEGLNGLTNEHLLAILHHRIMTQNERLYSAENVQALCHISDALNLLTGRTKDRLNRGVEGTEAV